MSELLRDTFTGTNGTAITAHTPDAGPTATAGVGTWQIQSNKLACTTPTNAAYNHFDYNLGNANQCVEVDFTVPSSGSQYITFWLNYVDIDNKWMVECYRYHGTDGKLSIIERTSGSQTTRVGSSALTIPSNANLHLSMTAIGDTVTARLTGLSTGPVFLTYTVGSRANKTGTHFRVGIYSDTGDASADGLAVFDNLRVTTTDPWLSVYADTALAAVTGDYNPATFAAVTDGTGSGPGVPLFAHAVAGAPAGATVYCRGGQTHTTGVVVDRTLTLRQFGSGVADLSALGIYAAGSPQYGVLVQNAASFSAYGTRGDLRFTGTYAEGDTTVPTAGTDITLQMNSVGGKLILSGCHLYGSGHAGLKFTALPDPTSYVEFCRLEHGGFSGIDHLVYDAEGGATYRFCEFRDVSGYGLHCYNNLGVAAKALACAFYNCGNVAGLVGGAALVDGQPTPAHSLHHLTAVNCGTGNGGLGFGLILWNFCTGTEVENCYVSCPGSLGDVYVNSTNTASMVASHNRLATVAGGGAAAYVPSGDVTTADVLHTTPDSLCDLARTGRLRDGVYLGADSDFLLDPRESWPTPLAVVGTPPIGAFAPLPPANPNLVNGGPVQ